MKSEPAFILLGNGLLLLSALFLALCVGLGVWAWQRQGVAIHAQGTVVDIQRRWITREVREHRPKGGSTTRKVRAEIWVKTVEFPFQPQDAAGQAVGPPRAERFEHSPGDVGAISGGALGDTYTVLYQPGRLDTARVGEYSDWVYPFIAAFLASGLASFGYIFRHLGKKTE